MRNLLIRFKTTIAGLCVGIPGIIYTIIDTASTGSFTGQHGKDLLMSIGIVLLGYFSKSKGVTGGVVPATGEAAKRLDADMKSQPLAK